MKKIASLLLGLISFCCCFSQSSSAYNAYLKSLCECYPKDIGNINSMNDASSSLGKCMNLIDTSLRNKAMREKNILGTDVQSLIKFEQVFSVDLLKECPGFMATIEKISTKQKRAVPHLPIVDTISESVCSCLKSKGVPGSKSIVTDNITECYKSSLLNNYDELLRQYKISDGNEEMLSGIGELISKLVMTNCKFYLEKLSPILKKN